MYRSPERIAMWTLLAALSISPALAASGLVADDEGRPLVGARVCHYQQETAVEQYCTETDADGKFKLMDSTLTVLRIVADHHQIEELRASGYHTVVMRPCPTLNVRLVDADTGEPLATGEVNVVYPTAKKKGPFPVNRSGVQIQRVLEAGEVRLLGNAPGYEDGEPLPVTLVAGKAVDAVLELRAKTESP